MLAQARRFGLMVREPLDRKHLLGVLLFGGANLVLAAAVLRKTSLAVVVLFICLAIVPLGSLVQRPQRGVVVLAAIVPFEGLLEIIPHPSSTHLFKEVLVVLILGCTFIAPAEARGRLGRKPPVWLAGAGALVGLGLVSAIVVRGSQAVYGVKLDFFYGLLAWAIWRCPLSGRERDQLITGLMWTGFISAVYGLVQQVLGASRLHALGYPYNSTITFNGPLLRSFGTFGISFGLGYFEMLVLLTCLPIALDDSRRRRNRLFLYLAPVYALGMFSSGIRGAAVGLAAGLVYLGVRKHRRVLLFFPLVCVVILLLPARIASSALSAKSGQERGATWATSVAQVTKHPLGLGIGASGSTQDVLSRGVPPSTTTVHAKPPPDNYYVKTLLDLGIVGLWLFVLTVVSIAQDLHRTNQRLTGEAASFAIAVTGGVVAAISAAVVATYFELFPMDLYFWLLVGVATTLAPDAVGARTSGVNLPESSTRYGRS